MRRPRVSSAFGFSLFAVQGLLGCSGGSDRANDSSVLNAAGGNTPLTQAFGGATSNLPTIALGGRQTLPETASPGGNTASTDADIPEVPVPGIVYAEEGGAPANPSAVGDSSLGGAAGLGGTTARLSVTASFGGFGGRSSATATAAGGTKALGGATSTGTTKGTDGCSNALASGLTISEIAVFQSGKITVMKSGAAATAVSQSGAEVIEGRSTLFRIYVTTDSGFQARQLSARLTISGSSTALYSKQQITSSSSELLTANSFQIAVPQSLVSGDLRYAVEIVECQSGTGSSHNPRFPVTGTASIATRATGALKVKLIPVVAGGITPNLEAVATGLKPHLESLYPTNLAQVTVDAKPITGCSLTAASAGNGSTWSDCLTLVRNRRISDRPANDVYYVGVVTPASTYAGYCGKGCVAGVGYVAGSSSSASGRAALGIGYLPQALNTIAHELGHNHGLNHSPGCNAASADTKFPYVTNGVAHIGWIGWSQQTPDKFFDPAKYTDLMAYCSPQWVSDYVYAKQADRIAQLNGVTAMFGTETISQWNILDVINGRANWGPELTEPEPAFGEAEAATVLDRSGAVLEQVVVYRSDVGDLEGSMMYLVPRPLPTWATLRIGTIQIAFR